MARAATPKPLEPVPESDVLLGSSAPRNTNSLYGHDAIERELLREWRAGRLSQALIFRGLQGIGKATLAWRLAKFLLAYPTPDAHENAATVTDLALPQSHPVQAQVRALSHPDVLVLRRDWNFDTKKFYSEISAEQVRRATGLFHFSSGSNSARVIILDSLEDLNTKGANALLKTIEEPPRGAYFIMIAHQGAFMLPTIRSRASVFQFQPLEDEAMQQAIAQQGGAALSAAQLLRAGGSVREALRLQMPGSAALLARIDALLAGLPQTDFAAVTELAHQLSGAAAQEDYATFLHCVFDYCHHQVARLQGEGAGALLALAEAYETITQNAKEVETLNLDKTAFVIGAFHALAEAV